MEPEDSDDNQTQINEPMEKNETREKINELRDKTHERVKSEMTEHDPVYAANTQHWKYETDGEGKRHWKSDSDDTNVPKIVKVPTSESQSGGIKKSKKKIAKKTPLQKKYNKKSKDKKLKKRKTIRK